MARMSFDDANAFADSNNTSGVDYLTLKNDGDEAVVRFMIDSVADFDIHTVHDVKVDNKYRVVECLRDPREPLDNCPLCKANVKIGQKFYIPLIQYSVGADGRVTPSAKIWERGLPYAKTLKTYLDNYGPLSDIMCKIVRHGKAGDMQTSYEIVPNLSPNVYNPTLYPKTPELFDGFSVLGRMVMDKTASDMNAYLTTGSFPAQAAATNTEGVTPRTYNNEPPVTVPPVNGQPAYNIPPQQTAVPAYQQHPVETGAPAYNTAPPFDTGSPAYAAPSANPMTPPRNPWDNPTPATGFDRPRRY